MQPCADYRPQKKRAKVINTHKKKADTGDQATHQVLIPEIPERRATTTSDDIPKVRQGFQEGSHGKLVVGLAVICGKPAAGAGI